MTNTIYSDVKMGVFQFRLFLVVGLCLGLIGCGASGNQEQQQDQLAVICQFDLSRVHPTGMYEDSSGLNPLIYRFCIPAYAQIAEQVRQIDPDIYLLHDSVAHHHCAIGHWVCEGHAKDGSVMQTLEQLAALPYIHQINRVHNP